MMTRIQKRGCEWLGSLTLVSGAQDLLSYFTYVTGCTLYHYIIITPRLRVATTMFFVA